MMEVWCEFHISCSHHLEEMGRKSLHGHTWQVRVYANEGPSAEDLRDLCEPIRLELDHKHLNDTLAPMSPTMENIARFFAQKLPWATRVSVFRSPEGLGADYRRE